MSAAVTRRGLVLLCATALLGCGKRKAEPVTETERTEFFSAVQDGDAMIVDRLLSAKPGLASARNAQGETALTIARRAGNDDLVAVIRRHGGTE
jgi:ankyrin repeat protein